MTLRAYAGRWIEKRRGRVQTVGDEDTRLRLHVLTQFGDLLLDKVRPASGRNGGVQARLSRTLGPYGRRPGGRWPGGSWFATEVKIQFEDTQVFRPDVAGWRRDRLAELPAEVPVTIRPGWVSEILSKNKRNDLFKKKRVYHRHQVGHYWISIRSRRRSRCTAGTPTATSSY